MTKHQVPLIVHGPRTAMDNPEVGPSPLPAAFSTRRQAFRALHENFNLLVVRDIGLDVGEIAALGVRRIGVGGALALAGWTAFMRAAQTLKAKGSFSGFTDLAPYAEINAFLAADLQAREARGV